MKRGRKRTPEMLIASAQKYSCKSKWRKGDASAYHAAHSHRKVDPETWRKCGEHMRPALADYRASQISRATEAASRFNTKKAWRLEDPKTYSYAKNWRGTNPDLWVKITAHMVEIREKRPNEKYCKIKYTDKMVLASALKFTTRTAWKIGDPVFYLAARRRLSTNPELWVKAVSHMVSPKHGPFLGSYFIYGCFFDESKTCYIGLSCRAESRRRAEHRREGRVANYAERTNTRFRWEVLERGLPDPYAVAEAEARWYDAFSVKGWSMLGSRTRCGSLGLVVISKKKKVKTNIEEFVI